MTNNPVNVSTAQLRRALEIREQIERLEQEISSILGGEASVARPPAAAATKRQGGRGMSAEGRARIIAAQKARWAKFHSSKNGRSATPTANAPAAPKRTMSPAARARLAKLAKARWAKVKASGKTRL
jgi:hypothetical protein